MAIWVSSDWHCDQEKLKEVVVDWISLGIEGGHRLVGDGDLFDILPLGKKKWREAASIKQLAELLDGYPFYYVTGNHDPYKDMRAMMEPYSANITVYDRVHKPLEMEEEGRKYFFVHGHRWSVDWGFLGLRHIAPRIVEFMVDIAPGCWYKFCKRIGWLASHPDPGASADKEKERITRLTRIIWAGASDYALRNDCCVVIGHTHTAARRERALSKTVGFQTYMVDGGNLPDGTFVEITDDAQLYFLDTGDEDIDADTADATASLP